MSEIVYGVESSLDSCPNPVHDEYNSQIDPELSLIIQAFEKQGLNVYVDLEQTVADSGINITDSMSDQEFNEAISGYAHSILKLCDLSEQDGLLLIRIREDVATWVEAMNSQDDYGNQHPEILQQLLKTFHDKVRVSNPEDMQQAAADALQQYFDAQFSQVITNPEQNNSNQQTETQQSDKNSADIPIVQIVGSGIGLAAIAAITAQSINIFHRRKKSTEISNQLLEVLDSDAKRYSAAFVQDITGDDLKDNVGSDEATWLLRVPEHDIPEISQLRKSIETNQAEWKALQAKYNLRIAEASRGLAPRTETLSQIKASYQHDRKYFMEQVEQFEQQIGELQEKRNNLANILNELSDRLQSLETLLNESNDGKNIENGDKVYSMPSLSQVVKSLREIYEQANAQFYFENLLNAPFEPTLRAFKQAGSLIDELNTIAETHNQVTEKYTKTQSSVMVVANIQDSANQIVEDVEANYHANCWGNVREYAEEISDLKKEIEGGISAITNPMDITNYDDILKISANLDSVNGYLARLKAAYADIRDRQVAIKEAEQNSHSLVVEIDSILDNAADFINEGDNAIYIDDDTEKVLFDLVPIFNKLVKEVEGDKPDYFRLCDQLENILESAKQAARKALEDRDEIITLERDIDDKIKEHGIKWQQLSDFESSNPDVDNDTENDILDARDDIDQIKNHPLRGTAENRKALQSYKHNLDRAIAILETLEHDANEDVAREEAKREAAREALRQAAIANERARRERIRAQNERNSSTTNFPSVFHSSGGGARSHSVGLGARSHSSGSGLRG